LRAVAKMVRFAAMAPASHDSPPKLGFSFGRVSLRSYVLVNVLSGGQIARVTNGVDPCWATSSRRQPKRRRGL